MTLRTSPDDARLLAELARARGVSQNEAALQAIRETAERDRHRAAVRGFTRRVIQEDAALLARLGE